MYDFLIKGIVYCIYIYICITVVVACLCQVLLCMYIYIDNFNLSMAQCPGSTSLNLFSREAECVAARGGISPNDQATPMHGPITKLALFEN